MYLGILGVLERKVEPQAISRMVAHRRRFRDAVLNGPESDRERNRIKNGKGSLGYRPSVTVSRNLVQQEDQGEPVKGRLGRRGL